ncbi:MAG: adenosylcobinamide-phosphate synthase CbiB [Methylophilaceae bacterium]|nr:adenosylcobinamide-phosphate synthase CbiB [Methylophilaceae bacterium]
MFSYSDYLTLPLSACLAVALDFVLGEPKRFHPLVGFGWLASAIERQLNSTNRQALSHQRIVGFIALNLLIVPFIYLAKSLSQIPTFGLIIDTLLLYFALGHKSLHDHARAVSNALNKQDLFGAKTAASYIVSRDAAAIDPIPATIESVLENGNDSVFGTLFWFFIAGGTGALAFRLINTMDAMWGYKTHRHYYFGWAAARLDDVAGYIPARLTALTYALLGHTRIALRCWRQQAPLWKSPNAGPVMASGAGALRISLGGSACYQGQWHERPALGEGEPPMIAHIEQALTLVRHGVFSWLLLILLISVAIGWHYA